MLCDRHKVTGLCTENMITVKLQRCFDIALPMSKSNTVLQSQTENNSISCVLLKTASL